MLKHKNLSKWDMEVMEEDRATAQETRPEEKCKWTYEFPKYGTNEHIMSCFDKQTKALLIYQWIVSINIFTETWTTLH